MNLVRRDWDWPIDDFSEKLGIIVATVTESETDEGSLHRIPFYIIANRIIAHRFFYNCPILYQ